MGVLLEAGSQLVIRGDGLFVGSVSGGCVEGAVVQQTLTLLNSNIKGTAAHLRSVDRGRMGGGFVLWWKHFHLG